MGHIFELGGRRYQFSNIPYLPDGEDWHSAYIPLVRSILSPPRDADSPILLPVYPLVASTNPDRLLFEMGSYWEGGIYFLCDVIGARSPLDGIRRLEIEKSLSFHENLFLQIWNSHGQLKWLKAHCIRTLANREFSMDIGWNTTSEDLAAAARKMNNDELKWLAEFVNQHSDEGSKYPNPYFGGTNPLHLSL